MEFQLRNISSPLQMMLRDQTSRPLALRQGQVILGKITDIFPDHIASIQFGKSNMVAKLEIPLSVEQSYLFKVTSVGDLPQLKVMSSLGANLSLTDQILSILADLELNPTKENQQMVLEMITRQIPIRQTDLEQAMLLFKNDQSQEMKTLLLNMLNEELPITETTLQSIKAVNSSLGLNSQIKNLFNSMENSSILSQSAQQLQAKLATIINKQPTIEANYIVNREQIINSELGQEAKGPIQELADRVQLQNQNVSSLNSKLTIASDSLLNQLNKQLALSDKQVFQFNKVLANLNNQQIEPTDKDLAQLQTLLKNNHVVTKIAQQLPNQVAASLYEYMDQATPDKLLEFIRPLTELIQLQIPKENSPQIFELLSQINQVEPNLFPVKDQFFIHMKNYMLNSGLDLEYNIYEHSQQLNEQPMTIKQLLLQVLSEQSTSMRETENLLNLLTGQQLTLVKEDASFLHLSTHIPGLFGMEEDIEIEFYSRKDSEEKIDTNYCRIAFYLELAQLGSTIIDMNVQDRVVHLTVYNGEDISESLDQHKGLVKEGLARLNYQLSTISYKALPNDRGDFMIQPERSQKGFKHSSLDVRV
ncbi:hypothetical protein KQI76_07180 [Amphibacillus sp. MSJ-3]|uniref:hypothetical protein n=1 Tax=Amphibacillus sp. MSJ-3 TaxID=2841505 RepID=UPI001C0ED891|nr:hypothetical protein [Amphibacillus sp. MSJ-3]MBU5594944.1 hypothetical protein [Amphibacillus sp. MSJ-3]